jgi:sulfotransferase family protein
MALDRPIFVVGCPRSGTTLLQLMLHAHPRIAIPPETRFLLPVFDSRHTLGDLRDAANRRELALRIVEDRATKFHDLRLDPDQVVEEIVAGPPTVGTAVGIVFQAYARRFDKPRWGDKRPAYIRRLDVLLRLFPDAQIVHLIRDGRDCVASLKEMPWYKPDSFHAVATWTGAIDAGRRAAHRLGPASYYEMRYERLVTDPEGELAGLCGFLGEEYDPAMARPNQLAKVAVPARKKWHSRTHGSLDPARAGSWAHRLDPWEIALCESVMGSRLTDYGYERTDAPRPPVAHLIRYAQVAARRRLATRKRTVYQHVIHWREPNPVAAQYHPAASHTGVTAS